MGDIVTVLYNDREWMRLSGDWIESSLPANVLAILLSNAADKEWVRLFSDWTSFSYGAQVLFDAWST